VNRFGRLPVHASVLLLLLGMLNGCALDVQGPTYTKDSVITTLQEFGVTAHYPRAQGVSRLLAQAKGERHLLQVDYIDQYEIKGGWVEVYIYRSAHEAYQDALKVRKDFDERFRHDEKMAELQGRKLERAQLPLFHHGNVVLYAGGIANNEEIIERINQTFGKLKQK
jgi:hypothetical protein